MWLCALIGLGFAFVLPVSAKTVVAGKAARLSEPTGGFSYIPPAGWHVRTFPGMKYRISYAMPSGGFAPNINVVDETAAVPMSRYVPMSLIQMHRMFSTFHLLSQTAFVTKSGLSGVCLRSTATVAGRNVRQVCYMFPAPSDRKLIVTASWLALDGDKYAQAVDASMKTFALQ
ncbi:MAG: hypothetical protein ACRYFS_07735 [Janthinobacterium lividum]